CSGAGVGNRPHIKTHKSPELMRLQLEAGAIGVTCQKLGEAEVMARAGAGDILISYNVLGVAKHQRLRALAARVKLTVCCDNRTVADGYAQAMAGQPRPLSVLVECDTGRHRCGVTTPEAAIELARHVAAQPGLRFEGVLMYPPDGDLQASVEFLAQVRAGCARHGLELHTVCSGGTPNWGRIGALGESEYRAGTYVYNDRQMVGCGAATLADCALLVYATVVSHPEPSRVMLDAGSKTLTSDLMAFKDHGLLLDYPHARLYKLAEEHGFVDVSACAEVPAIGEVVRILPNHACPVSNLFDRLLCTRAGMPVGHIAIAARGQVT
ncbi:MAG: alanine racemase, partial [Pseudomonadota bacterium]|nr:alanine racemase [Pseudomonadota bacterium]